VTAEGNKPHRRCISPSALSTRPRPLLEPRFSAKFSVDEFCDATTLLRLLIFKLEDDKVRCRAPGPTEAGRFTSCVCSAETGADAVGSAGDRIVGSAWMAWA
jgi:hypothetical protein